MSDRDDVGRLVESVVSRMQNDTLDARREVIVVWWLQDTLLADNEDQRRMKGGVEESRMDTVIGAVAVNDKSVSRCSPKRPPNALTRCLE